MSPMLVLWTALASLGANKLRASLTLLGIIIGVAAVISLMSIGRGVQQSINELFQSLGTNLVFVRPGSVTQGGVGGGQGSAATLTLDDAYSLVDPVFAPTVTSVAPELSTSGLLVAGAKNTASSVVGVTPEYEFVRSSPVGKGRFISPADIENNSQVVVLGSETANTLFGFRNPLGQPVRINGRQFRVIGVLEPKGGTGFLSFDDVALVPITTAHYRLSSQRTTQGGISVRTISVQVSDVSEIDKTVQDVATLLRLRHRIIGEDDFEITSPQDRIAARNEAAETFVLFLGAIAGISLLVGGIGIMNIMLVSVTERTREIGIRKAMGAKRRDILFQFVSEATLLSLGGGGIGVALGWVLSRLLNGRNLIGSPVQTDFSSDIALLALVVSAAIGLFFGIYPAMRAAQLHPIDALRYE